MSEAESGSVGGTDAGAATGGQLPGIAHGVLRIMTGLMFWQHGAQKLFGWLGGFGRDAGSVPWISWPFGVAGMLEFFGGILILFGLRTRPVAFLLAGEMAVVFWWRHFPNGGWPIQNRGEVPVLFCFIFLFLVVAGPGRFALDGLLGKSSD
jgi:putative oxidoreductase